MTLPPFALVGTRGRSSLVPTKATQNKGSPSQGELSAKLTERFVPPHRIAKEP